MNQNLLLVCFLAFASVFLHSEFLPVTQYSIECRNRSSIVILFRVLGRLYSLIHCLGIPCISLISSSVFPMSVLIPICQDMFLFQSLAYSLSCPVYTYYLTMKGDTRGGRTITKFPCPSHIFSSEPPQNSRPFKNIFLSVSNP